MIKNEENKSNPITHVKFSDDNNCNSKENDITRKNSSTNNNRYNIMLSKIKNEEKKKFVRKDSMVLYRNSQLKNKKINSSSEMLTSSLEYNEKTSDSRSILPNLVMKTKKPLKHRISTIITNNNLTLNKTNQKKKVKKVAFKKNFETVIEVESYKKYYIDSELTNLQNKSDNKCSCSCFIF